MIIVTVAYLWVNVNRKVVGKVVACDKMFRMRHLIY